MRMMGVHPAVHFLAWFLENVAVLTVSSAALALVLKVSGIFTYSSAWIVFLFLLDFAVSVVTLSYHLSALFSRASMAALCSSLLYTASFLPYIVLLVLHDQMGATLQTLLVSVLSLSRPFVSDCLRLHRLQHTRPPCPSPSPSVCPSSCPLSR